MLMSHYPNESVFKLLFGEFADGCFRIFGQVNDPVFRFLNYFVFCYFIPVVLVLSDKERIRKLDRVALETFKLTTQKVNELWNDDYVKFKPSNPSDSVGHVNDDQIFCLICYFLRDVNPNKFRKQQVPQPMSTIRLPVQQQVHLTIPVKAVLYRSLCNMSSNMLNIPEHSVTDGH